MTSLVLERGSAVWFLTEQACCLAQSSGRETDDFRACRETAEYLVGHESDKLRVFDNLTGAVKRDLTGLEDYDTEDYDGKRDDMLRAVIGLQASAADPATPQNARSSLLTCAEMIASFYGVDEAEVPLIKM